ncbi:MAG: hypothetical protein EOP00_33855 [Pedobacter sp.]|nr:MAG: hypothetical protein EOP00_33855 [Pedobacter sp.]
MAFKNPNQEDYLELESKDFSTYISKTESTVLSKYKTLIIMNNNWLIYPPGNRMPIDAEYLEIPKKISLFFGLKTFVIGNVFVNDLPREFCELKQLNELHLRLAPTSNTDQVILILKELEKLKKIDLSRSVLSKTEYIKFKKSFADGVVVSMMNEMNP